MTEVTTRYFPLSDPVEIFLLVLVIILFFPILFKKLRIPQIVGLILAGVMVGPHGFNILARDASFEIFGQVGILYLMFMAAVEIDMFHLRKNLAKGMAFGFITFAIPTVAGIFGSKLAFNIGWATAVLISTMYAAHTLISYPIVSRFGLQNSQPAVIAVCSTIVTVLLALMVLAGVIDSAERGEPDINQSCILILMMIGYALVIGFGLHYSTKYFFRKFSDQVSQFIYVLAAVFIASLVAKLIGLESILGAFYAGLVLNRFIPDRSGLMGRIKFVGNAIFIPYFLIGVGMLINIEVIFRSWNVVWVAANMVVVAMASKWVAALAGAKIFGLDATGRKIIFGLTSGKAAATIAAAMIGFNHGLLTEDMLNGAVLMILVSCIIASVVTEKASKKLRIQITESELTKDGERQPGEYARQLVAVANPVTAEGLMRMALLMRNRNNTNPVAALFVRTSDDAGMIQSGRNALKAAISAAQAVDIEIKDVERYDTNVATGVVNEAKQNQSTDIMIGLHRKANIVDTFYGTIIEQLLNRCNKMIFISRCFIPVDTLGRLVVVVPDKAEYESGFQIWVERVANLASQLASKVVFMAYQATKEFIEDIIEQENFSIRREYKPLAGWDDFIVHSAEINAEDLLIVIGARKGSISYSNDLEDLPQYLSKHHADTNLVVVYPEQFGGVSAFRSGIQD